MSNISKAYYKSYIEITLNLHENDDEKVKEKKVRKEKNGWYKHAAKNKVVIIFVT